MEYHVNQNLCTQCRLCIMVCPCNIIGENESHETAFIPERLSICIHCGQCMAVCPAQAVVSAGLSYEDDFIELPQKSADPSQFLDVLKSRRSIRNFKNKSIPREVIQQVIDSVSFAPFGASPEKMHLIIVNQRSKIESVLPDIEAFLDHIVKWIENPLTSWIIKRKKGVETFNTLKNHLYPIAKSGNYKLSEGDRISRGAPALLIFHAEKSAEEHTNNALINATYVILQAHALGLGAMMNGIIPAAINKISKLKAAFEIPTTHEAIISVLLGYPKIKYQRSVKRNDLQLKWINEVD